MKRRDFLTCGFGITATLASSDALACFRRRRRKSSRTAGSNSNLATESARWLFTIRSLREGPKYGFYVGINRPVTTDPVVKLRLIEDPSDPTVTWQWYPRTYRAQNVHTGKYLRAGITGSAIAADADEASSSHFNIGAGADGPPDASVFTYPYETSTGHYEIYYLDTSHNHPLDLVLRKTPSENGKYWEIDLRLSQ